MPFLCPAGFALQIKFGLTMDEILEAIKQGREYKELKHKR
jgi:hypothetical protein